MAHLGLSFDGAVAILTLSGPLNNRFGVEVVDEGQDLAAVRRRARWRRAAAPPWPGQPL